MRLRRIAGTKEKLRQYDRLIALEPENLGGNWQQRFIDLGGKAAPISLEIGCGRGRFITNAAAAYPNRNFIGLELREEMIMNCIQKLEQTAKENFQVGLADLKVKSENALDASFESNSEFNLDASSEVNLESNSIKEIQNFSQKQKQGIPTNLAFLWLNAKTVDQLFAQGEVDTIHLNFSDPWPKTKHAKRRLTHLDFLESYKKILAPTGKLILKTDNRQLFEFSQNQLLEAGFRLFDVAWDYPLKGAAGDIPTEYEMRYRKRGNPIYRLVARLPENFNSKKAEDFKMKYVSTRGNYPETNGAAAIRSGMVPGGGLFVPKAIPSFDFSWDELKAMNYQQLAERILAIYLTDFSQAKIKEIVAASYNEENFHHPQVAPLIDLKENISILELWHGPTAAFKDMALQIMPRLLVQSVEIEGGSQEVDILVATSGDTGKAALEGFKNVDGIKVIVFYPHNGVSQAQYLQMATTDGNNTSVVAVKGNFDNCQTGVKEIFGRSDIAERLAAAGKEFSSANSINWGRLLPQIIYYFWSYAQLLKQEKLQPGAKFNVVVPTGNFGNILAAYYALAMGLPINKLVCASNSNKVLADVLSTGIYDRRRDFVKTTSPSMDILVSSNFERFYYAMSGGDGALVAKSFQNLSEKGIFQVPEAVKTAWQKIMVGGYAEEAAVKATIGRIFKEQGYTLDPHTAVAVKVCEDYRAVSGDTLPMVVVSTASPYKFGRAVLEAINGVASQGEKESEVLAELAELSKTPIHFALQDLEAKPVLHNTVVEVDEMPAIVEKILHI